MKQVIIFAALIAALPVAAQDVHNPVTSECWFTALVETIGYQTAALQVIHPATSGRSMHPGDHLQVVEVRDDSALLAIDHAMGFWVDKQNGRFSGLCDDIPGYDSDGVRVTGNTRLWTLPDVVAGETLVSLPEGARVSIIGGSANGRIRYDNDRVGTWYPVQFGDFTGWVWAGRLDFDDVRLPDVNATASENARIWSQPDVVAGQVMRTLIDGEYVAIIGGPVPGRIRHDDFTLGMWYQVQSGEIMGWVWAERLELN